MPRWLSRQWPAPGVVRSALLNCVRGIPSRAAFSPGRRAFVVPVRKLESAIVIPRSASNTTPEDLLGHIKPLRPALDGECRFAVVFLTPAFATWLRNESFIRRVVNKAYRHAVRSEARNRTVTVLAAVVDKLPTPETLDSGAALPDADFWRSQNVPVRDLGHEGMAYALLSGAHIVEQPLQTPTADDSGSINFVTGFWLGEENTYRHVLELPLANTVFQTGSTTTMTLSTWARRRNNKQMGLVEQHKINRYAVSLVADPSSGALSGLAIPLMPLTLPRRVEASMGNIVRQIADENGSIVTASEELERVVPQYTKSRNEPSRALSVWALVVPKDAVSDVVQNTAALLEEARKVVDQSGTQKVNPWEVLWRCDPYIPNDIVVTALAQNARLHRVLSGGGGWGKKAGLLSLEPGINQEDVVSSGSGASDYSTDMQDLSSALNTVVETGDHIQFLVSGVQPTAGTTESTAEVSSLEQPASKESFWNWEIGTIPSTIDAMPAAEKQVESDGNDATVFWHSFGALAEGGLKLKSQVLDKETGLWRNKDGTKVDVPFARFKLVDMDTESTPHENNSNDPTSPTEPTAPGIANPESTANGNLPATPESPPDEPLMWPIRKYTVSKPPELELASICKIIEDRTSAFDAIMRTIVTRSTRQYIPIAELQNVYIDTERCEANFRSLEEEVRDMLRRIQRRRIGGVEEGVEVVEGSVYMMRIELLDTLVRRPDKVLDILHTSTTHISTALRTLESQAFDLVSSIRVHTLLLSVTKTSALEIYSALVALRSHISSSDSHSGRKNTLPRRLRLASLRALQEKMVVEQGVRKQDKRVVEWEVEVRLLGERAEGVWLRGQRFRGQAEGMLLRMAENALRSWDGSIEGAGLPGDVDVSKHAPPAVSGEREGGDVGAGRRETPTPDSASEDKQMMIKTRRKWVKYLLQRYEGAFDASNPSTHPVVAMMRRYAKRHTALARSGILPPKARARYVAGETRTNEDAGSYPLVERNEEEVPRARAYVSGAPKRRERRVGRIRRREEERRRRGRRELKGRAVWFGWVVRSMDGGVRE
ncbi:hypothetical protein BCR34DRAFT_667854 [Clohesyomyces aquaticus]|uniref:Uncharacterized protein n=1 Tax=Clohesyomyces aquaticus TaxID=1231657 RepID=A0A1Y1YV09_9PLEO|nr:hypothetical protein BCR34DRAFT_667854 [Clohesyomyces aquaticus]